MVLSMADISVPVWQAPNARMVNREDEEQQPKQTLHQHLVKTKVCSFFGKGSCQWGAMCAFAHDKSELKNAPNLWKTRLCHAFEKGFCRNGAACHFAHGKQELIKADLFYKKTMCSWYEKGRCRNGDRCCFAHGADELRGPRTPSELPGKAQRKMDVTSSLSVSTASTEHPVVEDADSATDSWWEDQDARGPSEAGVPPAHYGFPALWGLGHQSPSAEAEHMDVSYVSPGAFSVPPRVFFVPPGAAARELTASSALMSPMKIRSSLVLGE